MKELSIKEKARAYDEALEVAQRFYKNSAAITKKGLEDMFPVLAESEDEEIRKQILSALKFANHKGVYDKHIAWLEKQGEHANFRNKIQIGDKVTRNEDGVLVNLSQLNRVAKKNEKQGEQKPADKVEPKFHEGDWVVSEVTGSIYQIKNCIENLTNHKYGYDLINGGYINSNEVNRYHLWSIEDAKDGDVLQLGTVTAIFKKYIVKKNVYAIVLLMRMEFLKFQLKIEKITSMVVQILPQQQKNGVPYCLQKWKKQAMNGMLIRKS